jgi:predicted phosphodiesterase
MNSPLSWVQRTLTGSSLLVFGGPYSNLAATQAIRSVAERLELSPQQILCTGDAIAYCAEPVETIEMLDDWGIHWIKGNCEAAIATESNECGCGFSEGSACSLLSIEWYRYANQAVNKAHRNRLSELPEGVMFQWGNLRLAAVHATPDHLSTFIFASSDAEKKRQWLAQCNADILVAGHSGLPFGSQLSARSAWLNAGVIGMPANDGQACGWYMLLSKTAEVIEVQWLPLMYDVNCSYQQMQQRQLSQPYAEALLSGIWPSHDVLPETEKTVTGQPLKPFDLTLSLPPVTTAIDLPVTRFQHLNDFGE